MTVWWLVWRAALARRRLFAWNVAVPLLLLAPVAWSGAATPHRVAVFGVFYVFFPTFGAAVPTVRDAGDGWLDTVFQTGVSRRRWFLEETLAQAALDGVQLLPVTALLVLVSGGAAPATILALLAAIALTLAVGNALGTLVAAIVRSHAEAALGSAAVALLLLHLAGFFRSPTRGWARTAAALDPYTPLRVELVHVHAGVHPPGMPVASAVAVALGILLILAFGAPVWTRRLQWPQRA